MCILVVRDVNILQKVNMHLLAYNRELKAMTEVVDTMKPIGNFTTTVQAYDRTYIKRIHAQLHLLIVRVRVIITIILQIVNAWFPVMEKATPPRRVVGPVGGQTSNDSGRTL